MLCPFDLLDRSAAAMPHPTADDKKAMRLWARARRREAFARHGAAAGLALAAHGLSFTGAPAGVAVSGFAAIDDEIDPLPLMLAQRAAGAVLALPVMQGKGKPLVFRAWVPGDAMSETAWGIREPLATAAVVEPDIVLVPLLAFDVTGFRLGYGGGFYDRTLDRLRSLKPVTAVGVAYDELRVDAVPHLDYDQPLDWVLTPSGPVRCSGH